MFDPGNFTPHYVEGLCTALTRLDVRVQLITSPPFFDGTEQSCSIAKAELFFRGFDGNRKRFLQRHTLLRRGLKAMSYPLGLWRTWQTMRTCPPGVFHMQWALMPGLDALLLRKIRSRGWRVVFTAHDVVTDLEHPWARRWWRQLYRHTDAVVVHTPHLADVLRNLDGGAVRQIRVISQGGSTFPLQPGLDRPQARQAIGVDTDGPVLLFFGLIKPYKGLDISCGPGPS